MTGGSRVPGSRAVAEERVPRLRTLCVMLTIVWKTPERKKMQLSPYSQSEGPNRLQNYTNDTLRHTVKYQAVIHSVLEGNVM